MTLVLFHLDENANWTSKFLSSPLLFTEKQTIGKDLRRKCSCSRINSKRLIESRELIFISFPFYFVFEQIIYASIPSPKAISNYNRKLIRCVFKQLRSNNQQTSLLCYSITHTNRIAFISNAAYQIMMNEAPARSFRCEKLIKSQQHLSAVASVSSFRFM